MILEVNISYKFLNNESGINFGKEECIYILYVTDNQIL